MRHGFLLWKTHVSLGLQKPQENFFCFCILFFFIMEPENLQGFLAGGNHVCCQQFTKHLTILFYILFI